MLITPFVAPGDLYDGEMFDERRARLDVSKHDYARITDGDGQWVTILGEQGGRLRFYEIRNNQPCGAGCRCAAELRTVMCGHCDGNHPHHECPSIPKLRR